MKIKYIKDAVAGKSGDVAEVTDIEGNVLIALGFAEIHDPVDPVDPVDPKLRKPAKKVN